MPNYSKSIQDAKSNKRIQEALMFEQLLCWISFELSNRFAFSMPVLYSVSFYPDTEPYAYKLLATEKIRNEVIELISNNDKAINAFQELYTNNKSFFDNITEFAEKISVPNTAISKAYCNYNYLDRQSVKDLWKEFVRIFVNRMTSYLFSTIQKIATNTNGQIIETKSLQFDTFEQFLNDMANKSISLIPRHTTENGNIQKYFGVEDILSGYSILNEITSNSKYNPFIAQDFIYVEYTDKYTNSASTTAQEGYIYHTQFNEFLDFLSKFEPDVNLSDIFKKFQYGIRINQIDPFKNVDEDIKNNFTDPKIIRNLNKSKSYYIPFEFYDAIDWKQKLIEIINNYQYKFVIKDSLPDEENKAWISFNIACYPIDEKILLYNVIELIPPSANKQSPTISSFFDDLRTKTISLEESSNNRFFIFRYKLLHQFADPKTIEDALKDNQASLKKQITSIEKEEVPNFDALIRYCFPVSYLTSFYMKILANDLVNYSYNYAEKSGYKGIKKYGDKIVHVL